MKLTPAQIAEFEEQGYLFLPSLFSGPEMDVLNAEVPGLFAQNRPEVWREKGTDAPRTAFYVQTWNEVFARLARHPRLVEPGTQLLGSDKLYMHQFKINAKAAFDGAVWQWHQDYATWYEDDDMPAPRAMNIALFLAEANEFNGPLMFIPKSHRRGRLAAAHDTTTTSYPLWVVDRDTVARLAADRGLVSATGPAGTALIFGDCLVHGSPPNLSPWDRRIFSVILNPIANAYTKTQRPDYKHHHALTPVAPLADDCLLAASAVAAQ